MVVPNRTRPKQITRVNALYKLFYDGLFFIGFAVRMCTVPDVPFSTFIKEPKNYNRTYQTGERITLSCREGFKAKGNPVIICIGGSWTRFPFDCVGKVTLVYLSVYLSIYLSVCLYSFFLCTFLTHKCTFQC